MSRSSAEAPAAAVASPGAGRMPAAGTARPSSSLARLGAWSATHFRAVLIIWAAILIVFGLFAPRVESALAGAGWQDSSSQSVQARNIIQRDFAGLGSSALQVVVVDRHGSLAQDPEGHEVLAAVEARLRTDRDVSTVVPPQRGVTLSANGRTGIVVGGAATNPNAMVKAANALAGPLQRLSRPGVTVTLTGDSALWSDFNNANRSAMLRSEMLSWPVMIAILVVAFGSLIAAGLPLLLTMAGLLVAAGALVIATRMAPVSIWALNFALMFALALGIDYALFVVVRFRAALNRRQIGPGDRPGVAGAVAETLDTAGKAVGFSALTVLGSLASILIVPSPAFRSMALGIMLSVIAVLAATLTLLPAVLGRLGTHVNRASIRIRRRRPAHPHGSRLDTRLAAWGKLVWRRPILFGLLGLAVLLTAAAPAIRLRTNMPSITIIPASANARVGYDQVVNAFGPGAPGTLQVLVPPGRADNALRILEHTAGVAGVAPQATKDGWNLIQAIPTTGPSTTTTEATITRIRHVLPAGSLVGGAAAENYDLQQSLASHTLLVFGILVGLGFVFLLIALRAPLLAAAGVLVTALSVAGAFGIARLIFQDGWLHNLLRFQPQGFVDAWAPLFFGAMVFGVAMDYTLFLLSAAKERYETHPDPEHAMVGSLQTSGRVVVSAAAVMVAVFMTFALSGPLAPKEMGIILAAAVALDAFIVRLVLLPVVLRLGHRHSWQIPAWLGRILPKVSFAH